MNLTTHMMRFLFLAAWTLMIALPACEKNDDDSSGPMEPDTTMMMVDTFQVSCCDIPPLEACVGGAYCYIPNAFTPNGDGINDIFVPYIGIGVSEITEFIVSLPSGETVYEQYNLLPSFDTNILGWSGVLSDGTIANRVYDYRVVIKNIRDEVQAYEGQVCCRFGFSLPCVDNEKQCAYGAQHNGEGKFDPNLPTFEDCQ